MGFASLGSGSRGNGTVVALGDKIFLIDCGFNLKQTEKRLARIGLSGGDLDAILISHEHADHIVGVAPLAHKYSIDVYASYGTLKYDLRGAKCHPFDGDAVFEIGGVAINPVCVPHDAREPTQFVLSDDTETIGVLSDLGCITAHVVEQYSNCTHLLVEANHDRRLLAQGSYPPQLKRRVGADYGHLSNEQACQLLSQIGHPDLHVVIGHVSEQNNCPDILREVLTPLHNTVAHLQIATQSDGFDWIGQRPLIRQTSFSEVL
jgi:phosphoribosyl 1,2-cyclic phosphodiesterase